MGSLAEEARSVMAFFDGALDRMEARQGGSVLASLKTTPEEIRALARAEHERVTGMPFVPEPAYRPRKRPGKAGPHDARRRGNLTGVDWQDPAQVKRFYAVRRQVLRRLGMTGEESAAEIRVRISLRALRKLVREELERRDERVSA